MPEPMNPDAVDAALAAEPARPPDVVSLPLAEVQRLRAVDAAHRGLERDTAASLIDRDLATALAAHQIVPGAAPQLAALWKDDFVARRVDGKFVIEAKDGGSVAEVVKARLADPGYGHFVRAHARPGVGADGSRPGPTGGGQGSGVSYIDQLAANYAAERSQFAGRGLAGGPRG